MKVYLIHMRREPGIFGAYLREDDAENRCSQLNQSYAKTFGYLNPDDVDEYFVGKITAL